jgi:hypothetical protein
MTLRKTKLLSIKSVTGIATVGIFTAGATTTDAGTAGTTYVKSVVMHNTGLGTARVSLYVNPDTNPVITGYGITANRILRVDLAPNETTFFESNYPIVLTPTDAISVDITAPDSGGTGISSIVNFIINGDTDIA